MGEDSRGSSEKQTSTICLRAPQERKLNSILPYKRNRGSIIFFGGVLQQIAALNPKSLIPQP